jgi:hypothetical protein
VFLETYSWFVLHGLPWQQADADIREAFEQQWFHLVHGCLLAIRWPAANASFKRVCTEGAQHFRDLGALYEQVRMQTVRNGC